MRWWRPGLRVWTDDVESLFGFFTRAIEAADPVWRSRAELRRTPGAEVWAPGWERWKRIPAEVGLGDGERSAVVDSNAAAQVCMEALPDEDLEDWLTRTVLPLLRNGAWKCQPLSSEYYRMHMVAENEHGEKITLVTIFGTGTSQLFFPGGRTPIQRPYSAFQGAALYQEVVDAARLFRVLRTG